MGKIYFISDAHLGAKTLKDPRENERLLVRWLDSIKNDAEALYLLGDILDYWYEYKTVVPRGFTRFFGKIAEMTDAGIQVHWFIGNHDIWIFDYLPLELGITLHKEAQVIEIKNKTFFLAHGDTIGETPVSFRLMQKIFHNKFCQQLFSSIHPRWTVDFAQRWSSHSRKKGEDYNGFIEEKNEHLADFAKSYLTENPHIDYFIFGHRHIMLDLMLKRDSRLLILGDWIHFYSFAVFDGDEIYLEQYEPTA